MKDIGRDALLRFRAVVMESLGELGHPLAPDFLLIDDDDVVCGSDGVSLLAGHALLQVTEANLDRFVNPAPNWLHATLIPTDQGPVVSLRRGPSLVETFRQTAINVSAVRVSGRVTT
jgi:hypothetical protein